MSQKNIKKATKQGKKNKVLKLGSLEIRFTKLDLIGSAIITILLILYLLSPKMFILSTARYGRGTKEENKNVETALGKEDTEEKFNLYFQWYNVLHELGHGILMYNGNLRISDAKEEQLVNDFAYAYWANYGEEEKLNKVEKIVNYAAKNIKSDAKEGDNHINYAEKNWNKKSFQNFNNYGWFQFNCVKESFKKKKNLEEVLKEMKLYNVKLPEKKTLIYETIDEENCKEIVLDAIANIREWGLEFPDVHHTFTNDPNANYSRSGKNYFWIYNVIDN